LALQTTDRRETMARKTSALLRLIRFDKPIGTLLLLWPTFWALWIAGAGSPAPGLVLIFAAGTFLMRSAGCIVNDIADRNFDGAVSRTHQRPLVTGAVSLQEAQLFALLLAALAFSLVLLTNRMTVLLSLPALALACCYPFMKRYTHLPQVVLGAAFSWGIPMAFSAQSSSLPPALWLLYLANLLWTMAYDTEYAMVDREDDLKIGIKSTAILFGNADRLLVGLLQLATLLSLILAGQAFGLGVAYYSGLGAAALLFIYQQGLIRERAPAACFRAFLHNNWVGLVIFAGIAADYLLPTLLG
jgi:4-hydroxybenzoate polyprenyltransferase